MAAERVGKQYVFYLCGKAVKALSHICRRHASHTCVPQPAASCAALHRAQYAAQHRLLDPAIHPQSDASWKRQLNQPSHPWSGNGSGSQDTALTTTTPTGMKLCSSAFTPSGPPGKLAPRKHQVRIDIVPPRHNGDR